MGGGRMAAAAGGARARRPLGPASGVLIAALVVALLPAIPITARALLAATHGLTVVLQAEDDFWYGTFIVAIGLPRVLASLWIYYRAWNEWANEVALMALFLLSPVLGLIVWVAARDSITRPPRGLEHARIVDGRAVVPIYEPIYEAALVIHATSQWQAVSIPYQGGTPAQTPAPPSPQPYPQPYHHEDQETHEHRQRNLDH